MNITVFYRVWKQTVTIFVGIYLKRQPRDIKLQKKNTKRAKVENYLVPTTCLFTIGIPNVYVNIINIFVNRMFRNSLLTFVSVLSHIEQQTVSRGRDGSTSPVFTHPHLALAHTHSNHATTRDRWHRCRVGFIGRPSSAVCFKGTD